MAVYEEISRAQQIIALLDDADPDKKEILETETDIFTLIDWACRKVAEIEEYENANKALASLYADRAKSQAKRKDGMRVLLKDMLEATRERSHKGKYATLSIKATPPKVVITDEESLPDDCFKTTRKPVLSEIKSRIDSGEEIPGATLSNGGESLTIRKL